mgnify:CR=1 FL=1
MYEHMETVMLGGKEYPIKCDIDVLIKIQEQFDGLNAFEMLIGGFKTVKRADGSTVLDDKGIPLLERAEPSVRAIRTVLPYMLQEAAVTLKDITPVDLSETDEAIKNMHFDMMKVARAMYHEFNKCFERKNVSSAGSQEEKQE